MSIPKHVNYFTLVCCFLWTLNASAQTASLEKSQAQLLSAISIGYPATVKLVEVDTLKKTIRGGAFSGVVVTADGHILTAAHAMLPRKVYKVYFPDGTTATAEGLGRIGSFDAAVMKIREEGNFKHAEMGWSSNLTKQSPVFSVGFPATINSGIVPIVRFGYISQPQDENGYIQSTCLMEPGDSGGPLFDISGSVIGIHSHIMKNDEDNFDVPIDIFRKYWPSLIKKGNHFKDSLIVNELIVPPPANTEENTFPSREDLQLSFLYNVPVNQYSFVVKSTSSNGQVLANSILVDLDGMGPALSSDRSFFISTNTLISENPFLHYKKEILKMEVIKRDTVNDLVLLSVKKLKRSNQGVKLSAKQLNWKPGSFVLSPIKTKQEIKLSIIGAFPFDLKLDSHEIQSKSVKILVQDAIIENGDCGGPVFDTIGNFVGLNLRRYNRTSVIIVPAQIIQSFIKQMPAK